ncbi:hypothetical protein DUI87_04312 [Hirundo rustica rustica]|uniref:Uncharacterized protein n=1 Tax=Hirundo rustica rustica TaxID=333673 RepID=A0A3M0KZ39_HIRRU|nr:hypothetical protein DUI87_04312 [Hirundo rustica rustica]
MTPAVYVHHLERTQVCGRDNEILIVLVSQMRAQCINEQAIVASHIRIWKKRENPALVKEGTALKYFMSTVSIMQFADWGFQQQPECEMKEPKEFLLLSQPRQKNIFLTKMLDFTVGESAGQSELQHDPPYSSATAEALTGNEHLLIIQQLLKVSMKRGRELELRKTSGVSCHLQAMTNYYGTCNPEAFGMICTPRSKMNVKDPTR